MGKITKEIVYIFIKTRFCFVKMLKSFIGLWPNFKYKAQRTKSYGEEPTISIVISSRIETTSAYENI